MGFSSPNWKVEDVTGDAAADLTISGQITNANALTKTGVGTMVISGNNTYTGGTNANEGVLQVSSIADAGGIGSIGTGYLGVANDGTFRYTGTGTETSARNLWIDTGAQNKTIEVASATGDITFSGTGGNINKPFTKTGLGALTLADVIDVGATVTVNGGKLTLTGVNTYTGTTTVSTGTLVIDEGSIASSSGIVNNAALEYKLTTNARTYSNVISGTGSLTKTGTNTLTLGGANTYTGNTVVNSGTLALADNAQLKFVLGASSGSSNSLSGAGTATLDGDFVIDTTAADALASGSWT
ncbi:MAG: hypothetical protein CFE26_21820, partial [Verrucomicrobiales bacterium VVV1]